MRVLFVMKYPLVDQYSIMQKLNGEINAVRNLGHEANYISFDRDNLYLDNGENKQIIKKTTFGHSKFYFHTVVFSDINKTAERVVASGKYDLMYFRHSPIGYRGYKMLKTASKKGNTKVVVEIPSFPLNQDKPKNLIRRLYVMYSDLWWKRSSKFITLFAGIGEKTDAFLGVPYINIDNGIDINLIPERKEKESRDGKIHLLAVASMCEWHGYERIIKGLSEWKDKKAEKYVLDLVGDEGDGSLSRWKTLTHELGIEKRVIFHGRMTGDALTEMYNTATVGLSSLAMYKVGFQYGSVLKLREYMARGLPFVYAHDDPHMSEDLPWCLKIPNDGSTINMERIDEFVNRIEHEERLPHQMREYAKENMTWESQFQKIFSQIGEP